MSRRALGWISSLLLIALMAVWMPAGWAAGEQMIDVTFRSYVNDNSTTWPFPYDDAFFAGSSAVYSHDTARASLGLALAAARGREAPYDEHILAFLEEAGFVALESTQYNVDSNRDTIATVIGHKILPGGETLLVTGVSGIGYGDEFLSNLDIGDGEDHRGFATAAEKVVARILAYMEKHAVSGPCKLWISGYSRGAAVTNLATASLMEQGVFNTDNAFAYTFATPRSTQNPVAYPNIINIVGKFDPATQIPYQEWGFGRHGVNLFTPAQETDSDYRQRAALAGRVYEQLTGQPMRNSVNLNHNYTVIAEYLLSVIPSIEYYDDILHEHMEAVWNEPSMTTLQQFVRAMSSPAEMSAFTDEEHREKLDDLVDYLMGIIYGVVTYKDVSTADATVALLMEHLPEVYISWLFSNDDPEKVFSDKMEYIHLALEGDANVTLFDQKGGFILTIDPEGNYVEETDEPRYLRRIRPIDDRPLIGVPDMETRMLILPKDQGMPFVIDALSEGDFTYYGVKYRVGDCTPTITGVRIIEMMPGEQYLAFSFTEDGMRRMGASDTVWGDADISASFVDTDDLLSMEITADMEEFGNVSISLKTMLTVVLIILGVLLLLFLLILFLLFRFVRKIARRIKRRRQAAREAAQTPQAEDTSAP